MKPPAARAPSADENEIAFHLVRATARATAGAEAAFGSLTPAVLKLRLQEILQECARASRLAHAGLAILEARMRDLENQERT